MLSACVAVMDCASVTLTVNLLVPHEVGTPEMTPVLDASLKPEGSRPEVMDQL
jgi:hypothetical protein